MTEQDRVAQNMERVVLVGLRATELGLTAADVDALRDLATDVSSAEALMRGGSLAIATGAGHWEPMLAALAQFLHAFEDAADPELRRRWAETGRQGTT